MTRRREIRSSHLDIHFGGGINQRDQFNISIEECTEGQNFVNDPVSRVLQPRPPQDLKGTAPNALAITGILQLIKRDDSETQLVVSGDTIYTWDGGSTFSDVTPPIFTSGVDGTRMRSSYWSLDEILVMTDIDLENPLYKWNGTTVARLKVGILGGNSQSVTSLTCTGSTATATVTAHGYATGDLVTIAGANETEYNGEVQITATGGNTFTYTMSCSTSPATGTITAEKNVEIKAKYSVVHQSRVWLFNIEVDGTATPHAILVSEFENVENYDNSKRAGDASFTTGDEPFFLLSPDLKPINGVAVFFDTIVVSTVDGRLFRISGVDSTDYSVIEFYGGSNALGEEGLANIGDDLLFFRRGKVVESLRSTDTNFDVETDDRSWWIETLAQSMDAPIVVYDQTMQKVYFFDASLKGVLVFDKTLFTAGKTAPDTGQQLSPWTLYKTQMTNNFVTKAATQIRVPNFTNRTVYWGDSAGNIYDMNGTGTSGDAGSKNISMRRKSKIVTDLNITDEIMIGRLEYKRENAVNVELIFNWMDDYHRTTAVIPLKGDFGLGGAAFFGGEHYWNETDLYWSAGSLASEQVSTQGWSVPSGGSGFTLEIQTADVDTYTISRIFV